MSGDTSWLRGKAPALTNSEQDDFVPTPRPVVARTGRAATKKPAYVDMSDEDDD